MPGIQTCFRLVEITPNCIRAHGDSPEATVDDALERVRDMLLQSVQSMKEGTFQKGVTLLVGYGPKYPDKEGA